jgi:hypothetical protein
MFRKVAATISATLVLLLAGAGAAQAMGGDVSKSDDKFRLTKINGSTTTNYQLAVKTVAVKC